MLPDRIATNGKTLFSWNYGRIVNGLFDIISFR